MCLLSISCSSVSEEETCTAITEEKCDNRFEAKTILYKPEQAYMVVQYTSTCAILHSKHPLPTLMPV